VNRKSLLGTRTIQLSTAYTDREHHSTHRHRQTDGSIMPIADCTVVQSDIKSWA